MEVDGTALQGVLCNAFRNVSFKDASKINWYDCYSDAHSILWLQIQITSLKIYKYIFKALWSEALWIMYMPLFLCAPFSHTQRVEYSNLVNGPTRLRFSLESRHL